MKPKDIFQYTLAAVIILGWLYLFRMIFVSTIPVANQAMANQMFGALTMAVATVVSYFFGTNKESAAKTEMLYKSTPTNENPPN